MPWAFPSRDCYMTTLMIRQSNGLVQSDNKLLPNTDVDQALSFNMVSLGYNEFSLVAMLVFLYSYLNDVVILQWLVAWLTIIHVNWLVTYGVVIWILDVGIHQLSKWALWNYGGVSSWKILYSNLNLKLYSGLTHRGSITQGTDFPKRMPSGL